MPYSAWIRRHRRTLGIPLVIAALLLARLDPRFLPLSLAITAAGEIIRIWSAGHLRKEQILTTGGPYRFLRNPLYLGSFLIAIGFCLAGGSLWIWILVFAYFLCCYIPVVRFEEGILREKFPGEFPPYASAVPAFLPGFKPYPTPSTRFTWQQVLRNKEYNAVLGILAGYAYLFADCGSRIAGLFQ